MTLAAAIPFVDLAAQRAELGDRIETAIRRVLDHGVFVMGPEVRILEDRLAEFVGVRHAVSCSSGTDALVLALLALGVGPGQAVIVPTFTFAATAEAVALLGATPVFADVSTVDFNMGTAELVTAAQEAERRGLRTTCAIAVDLFGQPADYPALHAVCAERGLVLVADAAQSFGATQNARQTGSLTQITTTSFFPAKPLGCYGDGGAVFTDDDDIAALLRSLRIHGQGADKYQNVRIGINGRLDTLQAAILIEKLMLFPREIEQRSRVAGRYEDALSGVVRTPAVRAHSTSVWAQYTIQLDNRDRVAHRLRDDGIPTAVYYPQPLHRQAAYAHFPCLPGGLPVAEGLAERVLSIPMHPYLDPATQDRICDAIRRAVLQESDH